MQERFFDYHLPHRVNLLIAFRERYSQSSRYALDPEQYRDLYRCAKDIAMMMVRFFCDEVGAYIPRGGVHVSFRKEKGSEYGAKPADPSAFLASPAFDAVRQVLIAANRAVAHIALNDVDHTVDDATLISAINVVEEIVQTHLYPSVERYREAMRKPQNVMLQ